ncbi:hypothetical protein MAR_004821, partial [Mya arenaria]
MTLPGRKASQKDIALHWGGKKDPKGFAIKFYGFKVTQTYPAEQPAEAESSKMVYDGVKRSRITQSPK